MKPTDLESMSVDELWSLRALLIAVLTGKMSAEKAKIDRQLQQLGLGAAPNNSKKIPHARRPYPQVFPKYSNPAKPSETWAGRGKQPRWLTAQLRAGKKLDDFRIQTLPLSHSRLWKARLMLLPVWANGSSDRAWLDRVASVRRDAASIGDHGSFGPFVGN